MNTIGNSSTLPVLTAPKVSVPAPKSTATLPEPVPQGATQQPEVFAKAAERQLVTVKKLSQQPIANTRVLGSTVDVQYKNSDGETVTRTRDIVTGKVSYIPEPQFPDIGVGGALDIKA